MYDINFFDEIITSQRKKRISRFYRRLVISVVIGLTMGLYVGNLMLIGRLDSINHALDQSLNDPEMIRRTQENEEKKIELLFLQAHASWLVGLDARIKQLYIKPGTLIDRVFNSYITGLTVEQAILNRNGLTLRGIVNDTRTAALYKAYLGAINNITDVKIQQLFKEGDVFRFTITLTIGSVEVMSSDENKDQ